MLRVVEEMNGQETKDHRAMEFDMKFRAYDGRTELYILPFNSMEFLAKHIEEGINLSVDSNSSPSEWINNLKRDETLCE